MKLPPTPLLADGDGLFLKAECLQSGGSYKIRGVARLLEAREVPPGGFSTVSAGNLGRALALACREAGVPCTIYVPHAAPAAKKDRILALGAQLVELPFDRIWDLLLHPPAHSGFVHPTLCPELRDGYGGIAREIARQLPGAGAVVAPFGLGALAFGVAEALPPGVAAYAAELSGHAPLAAALGLGERAGGAHAATFVDAIGTPALLPGILPEARARLAGTVPATLEETRASLRHLRDRHGLVVEGAAAVAHAAARKLSARFPGLRIVAVLSGGNIGPAEHARECELTQGSYQKVSDTI